MTVKNVLKGLTKEYALKEINIITDEKVVFSGTVELWNRIDPAMIDYKQKVLAATVKNRMVFNCGEAFIFI